MFHHLGIYVSNLRESGQFCTQLLAEIVVRLLQDHTQADGTGRLVFGTTLPRSPSFVVAVGLPPRLPRPGGAGAGVAGPVSAWQEPDASCVLRAIAGCRRCVAGGRRTSRSEQQWWPRYSQPRLLLRTSDRRGWQQHRSRSVFVTARLCLGLRL